jgi:hypothetical protein
MNREPDPIINGGSAEDVRPTRARQEATQPPRRRNNRSPRRVAPIPDDPSWEVEPEWLRSRRVRREPGSDNGSSRAPEKQPFDAGRQGSGGLSLSLGGFAAAIIPLILGLILLWLGLGPGDIRLGP